MLNVIDTFLKYVWSRQLKNGNGINASNAFEGLIKDLIKVGCKSPNLLHTDKRLVHKNREFNSLMCKYNMKLY